MADDKKETGRTTRRTARTSRATKRPARTIDLEAKEVPEDEAEAAKKEPVAQVTKPPEKTKKQDKASPEASGKKADAEKTAAGGAPDAAAAPQTAATQPRTTKTELRSFATHLAAGLVGGLIGVVVGGVGISQFSSGAPDGADTTGQEIAQLQSRLGALQTELDAQKKAVETASKPPEVSKADLDKVESRIATVERAAAASASASATEETELSDRISKLEDVLKAVQSSAGTGAGDAATLELSSRLAALSDALKKQKAGLDAEIESLKTSVAERGDNAPAQAATEALDKRTKSLETQLAKLSSEVRTSEGAQRTGQDGGQGAALALAFEALRRAVTDGDHYADQLALFREYAPESLELSGISAYAKTGVPRQRALLKELSPVLEKASVEAAKADDETFLDRLVSNAQAIVRVRRIGPVQGEDASAILSRMESDMRASDLSGVLREAAKLTGPAAETLKPWLAKAEMREAAISALDAVERELLKQPVSDPNAAAKR